MKTKILKTLTLSFFVLALIFFVRFKASQKSILEYMDSSVVFNDSLGAKFITVKELRVLNSLIKDSLPASGYYAKQKEKREQERLRIFSSKSMAPVSQDDLTASARIAQPEYMGVIHYFNENLELGLGQIEAFCSEKNAEWKYVNISAYKREQNADYKMKSTYENPEEFKLIHQKMLEDLIQELDSEKMTSSYEKMIRSSSSKFFLPLTWHDVHQAERELNFVEFYKLRYPETTLSGKDILDSLMAVPYFNVSLDSYFD